MPVPAADSVLGSKAFDMPVGDDFPDHPPALPLEGSSTTSLSSMQHWRSETYASAHEYYDAVAALRAARAAQEAAAAALEAAEAFIATASQRVDVAMERRRVAWENVSQLMGYAFVASRRPPVGLERSRDFAGKGKGRAVESVGSSGEDVVISWALGGGAHAMDES